MPKIEDKNNSAARASNVLLDWKLDTTYVMENPKNRKSSPAKQVMVEQRLLHSFWSAVDFALEFLHGQSFYLVSFLVLNYEQSTQLSSVKVRMEFLQCIFFSFFCDLLDELLMLFWNSIGRPSTTRKVHHCSRLYPFVGNGSHCVLLECQCLVKICNPFQTSRYHLCFFLIYS